MHTPQHIYCVYMMCITTMQYCVSYKCIHIMIPPNCVEELHTSPNSSVLIRELKREQDRTVLLSACGEINVVREDDNKPF